MSMLRDRHQFTASELGIRRMRSRHVLMHALRRKMLHEVADDILPLSFTDWSHENIGSNFDFSPDAVSRPPAAIVHNSRSPRGTKFKVRIMPEFNYQSSGNQNIMRSNNELKERLVKTHFDGNRNYVDPDANSLKWSNDNNTKLSRKYLQDNSELITQNKPPQTGLDNSEEQKRYRSSITFQCNPANSNSSKDSRQRNKDLDYFKYSKTSPRPGFEPETIDYSSKYRCSGDGAELPNPVRKEMAPIPIPVYHVTDSGTFVNNVTSSENKLRHSRPYVRRIRLPDNIRNRNVKIRVTLPKSLSSSNGDRFGHASRQETVTSVPPQRDSSAVSSEASTNVNNRTNNGFYSYSIANNSDQLKKNNSRNSSAYKVMCDKNGNKSENSKNLKSEIDSLDFQDGRIDKTEISTPIENALAKNDSISIGGPNTINSINCNASNANNNDIRKSAARNCILRNLMRTNNPTGNNVNLNTARDKTLNENSTVVVSNSQQLRDNVSANEDFTTLDKSQVSANDFQLQETNNISRDLNENITDNFRGTLSNNLFKNIESNLDGHSISRDEYNTENGVIKSQVFTASTKKDEPNQIFDQEIRTETLPGLSLENGESEKSEKGEERKAGSRDSNGENYTETDSSVETKQQNMSTAVVGINCPRIYSDNSIEFGTSFPEESTSFSNIFNNYSRPNEHELNKKVPHFYEDLKKEEDNIKNENVSKDFDLGSEKVETDLNIKDSKIDNLKKGNITALQTEILQEKIPEKSAEIVTEISKNLDDKIINKETDVNSFTQNENDVSTEIENKSSVDEAANKFTTNTTKPSSPVNTKNEKNLSLKIPKFYFPKGQPCLKGTVESTIAKIEEAFNKIGKEKLTRRELGPIAGACGLSAYWKSAIFKASNNSNLNTVTRNDVITMWKKVTLCNHDDASRFISMLAKKGNSYLEFDDFLVLLQDIVEGHPGLVFLRDAPEFHTRYMNTVIARIFYQVNRSWSGQITVNELRKSNFLSILSLLDDEEDINAITEYFSYEHFYVIYCKFWELDMDHDLIIDKADFLRHSNGALSSRLIDRVLCGAVTRWDASDHRSGKMSYVDFVWFLISEEDKTSATSIEYWFRCMDINGDGMISMYEMEFFYEEQMRKLEQLDIEPLPFEDCICQMLDMVKPVHPDFITLKDLKNCKMANLFFDTFFNVEKYLGNEQKDPFAPPKDHDSSLCEPSDWEKYAAEEYEILVAEEQGNEGNNMELTYEEEEVDPLVEEELRNLGIVTDMASLGAHDHHLANTRKRERYSVEEANALDPVKS